MLAIREGQYPLTFLVVVVAARVILDALLVVLSMGARKIPSWRRDVLAFQLPPAVETVAINVRQLPSFSLPKKNLPMVVKLLWHQ
jgi:hypothetical protein